MNVLIRYTKPAGGRTSIFGKDVTTERFAIHADVGFFSSDMALDGALTGRTINTVLADLKGTYETAYVNDLVQQLGCDMDKKIKTLSRGNRKKIVLVVALMHKPNPCYSTNRPAGLIRSYGLNSTVSFWDTKLRAARHLSPLTFSAK